MRRNSLKTQFYDDLVESLDKLFPKGKCKERGAALVFFTDAFRIMDKLVKAFGGCDNCFGKGYGTKTEFYSSGSGDFEYKRPITKMTDPIVCCVCPRGKQLKKLMKL